MLEEAVRYSKDYEIWIYALLGVVALFSTIKFFQSWEELRKAGFGMERDSAQYRLNQSSILLVILLTLAAAEFSVVTFIAPTIPGANPIPTPTLDLLATPTTTPMQGDNPLLVQTQVPTPTLLEGEGCSPGQVMITAPKDGDSIAGVVVIEGTADIPNFGFYKYEIARPGDTVWLSINAGENVVQEGILGEWVTSVLPPGDYLLRLVVADNQGKFFPACTIQVRVQVEP